MTSMLQYIMRTMLFTVIWFVQMIKDYLLLSTHTFIYTIFLVLFYRKLVLIAEINIKVYFKFVRIVIMLL